MNLITTKNDINNASLVRKSIENIRIFLMDKSIKDIKVSDIISITKISKSKFYNFFGGLDTLFEIVLKEELMQIYDLIASSIKTQNNVKNLIVEINLLRVIYIRNNQILNNYYKISNLLPRRYNRLREAISVQEINLLLDVLAEHGASPDKIKKE